MATNRNVGRDRCFLGETSAKGAVKASKRLVVGLWEVATFYHPTRNNYQPYIEPEVVFMDYLH